MSSKTKTERATPLQIQGPSGTFCKKNFRSFSCIKLWVCVTALRSSCAARGQKEPRNGSDGLYTDGSSAAQIDNSRRQQKVFGTPKDLLSLKIHPFHHVMGPRGMVIVGFISSCRTLSSCNLVKLGWNPGSWRVRDIRRRNF